MSRFRIVAWDGGDSMYSEEVIADFLTKAEAKSIIRHYCKVGLQNNWKEMYLEVLYDGVWENCTYAWAYRELGEQEEWFEEKGLDFDWWFKFGEIRKI